MDANAKRVEALYAKYGPTIYSRCRRLLRDTAQAEDATQDVFLKVLKHLASAPKDEAALPWIYRITTNHCLNLIRDGKHDPEPVAELPEQRDDDFEDSLVTRDFAARVLASASEEHKAPAMLYHARGVEQGKVASLLGVSRRTVLYRLAAFTAHAQAWELAADQA
ncbi:MAG: sigma-70 family RNA polymerase sigma factor [Myxococcaceae bacterium]|nr:sigma-70 family RNA polymerase sigma factor [Myxococcaceae bacterium]